MKNLITTLILSLFLTNLIGQNSKVWVTAQNQGVIKELSNTDFILSLEKALPASKQVKLQNVYEIETSDLLSFLRLVEKNPAITNPELIEEFTPLYTTNDLNTEFANDYALSLINAQGAWDITKGDPIISIGVLDTGFDTIHEELVGKFNHVSQIDPGANITHGTAVAITAAGNTDNNVGKSSIGFDCQLSLRNMSYNEMLNATYAGVRVINISWASGCMNNSYYQSVIDEVYNNGTTIIAAAGNGPTCGGANQLVYPAAYNNVIAVTSIDENDHHRPIPNDPNSTHQHNAMVDLSAPGYDVPLSINGNQYLTGNGTSFAAPYVSGTVGLMLSANPCLTPAEIESILKSTSDDIYAMNPDYIGQLGAGRLNAEAAVQKALEMHPIKVSVIKNASTCNSIHGVFVSLDSGSVSNHTIQWSDGSHDWNRYNLPNGDYTYMISNTNGCLLFDTLSFATSGPEFDYLNSIHVTSENQQIVDLNNDGVIKIKGTVIINSGVDYELNGKNFKFASNSDLPNNSELPSSGIVIQPDAGLLINNCTLDTEDECGSFWGGIEVLSNGLNQQGILNITQSEVRHAQIGISTIAKSLINVNEEDGGNVSVDQCLFSNNQKSIYLTGQGRSTLINEVRNSDFTTTEPISNSKMIHAVDITFKLNNCYFQGNFNLPMNRGIGIHLDDAQLSEGFIKSSPVYRAEFNSLETGVLVENNASDQLKINNMFYTLNLTGIQIENSKNVIASNNTLELMSGTYSNKVSGITQKGQSSVSILDNTFESTGNVFTTAIIIDSQTEKNNMITKNSFTGDMGNAVAFVGANEVEQFACNDFDLTSGSDVSVLEKNSINGSLDIQDELLLNQFSNCNNVNSNLNFLESSSVFTYTDHSSYTPTCTDGNIQIQYLATSIDREEKCNNVNEMVVESRNLEKHNTDSFARLTNNSSKKNNLYPNPNQGEFEVEIAENIDEIKIFDNSGKLVKQLDQNQLSNMISVDLAAGYYTVAYINKNVTKEVLKMVIN